MLLGGRYQTIQLCFSDVSPSFLLFGVVGNSKAEAGVLGVFLADPKPNAPEPRPKELEGRVVGDEMLVVAMGGILLNGFERPESNRLFANEVSPF